MANDVEQLITPKAKLLAVNSPNNDTGRVTAKSELTKITDFVKTDGFYVVCNEAYEKFRHDGETPFNIASMQGMKERGVTFFSFSNSYSMTGSRIGFSTGPREIMAVMTKMQEHLLSMPTPISQ